MEITKQSSRGSIYRKRDDTILLLLHHVLFIICNIPSVLFSSSFVTFNFFVIINNQRPIVSNLLLTIGFSLYQITLRYVRNGTLECKYDGETKTETFYICPKFLIDYF